MTTNMQFGCTERRAKCLDVVIGIGVRIAGKVNASKGRLTTIAAIVAGAAIPTDRRESAMNEYHKIQTVFKRDPVTKYSTLLPGEYMTPEFEYLCGLRWEFTEKLDGTNIRVMFKPASEPQAPDVIFGGKTKQAQIPAKLFKHLQKAFPADLMNRIFDSPVCLYGEGCGAGIQKGGGNYYPDQRFVLFDVRVGDWWLQRMDVEDIAAKLRIPVVPVIGHGALAGMVVMAQCGFKSQWGDFRAEGIVARPMVELHTRGNERIITKLKCKDFK